MSRLLTIADAVATHARLSPAKIGVRDSRRQLSFAEWNRRASSLAHGLLGLGLRKGDRVGVLAYNCIEWMEIYVALARAGLVALAQAQTQQAVCQAAGSPVPFGKAQLAA